MTEQQYTPDTATVREVYYAAPGNRDWEAARAASFDRWLDAHDAEVRAVQSPPREQIDSAVGAVLFNVGNFPETVQARMLGQDMSALRGTVTDAVLALFPQPTPSAEQTETLRQLACEGHGACRSPLHVHGCYADDGTACDEPDEHKSATPTSIADMAPGTTFTANEGNRYMRTAPDVLGRPGDAVDVVGWFYQAHQFDPSTIRDVTPPPTTPGEGDDA